MTMTPIFVKSFFVVALCLVQVFDFAAAQFVETSCDNATLDVSQWRSVGCPPNSGSKCTMLFDTYGRTRAFDGCNCRQINERTVNCTKGLQFTIIGYVSDESPSGITVNNFSVKVDWPSRITLNNVALASFVDDFDDSAVCRSSSEMPLTPPLLISARSKFIFAVQACSGGPACTCSAPTDVPDPTGVFCPRQTISAPTNWTSPGCPVTLPSLPSVPANASCGSLDFTYNFKCGKATFSLNKRVTVGDSGPIFNASTACAADGAVPSYTTTCNGTPRPLQIGYPGGCKVQATYSNFCGTFKLCDDINLNATCAVI